MAIYTPQNDAELSAIVAGNGDVIQLVCGRTYSAAAFPAALLTPSNVTLGYTGTGAKPIITGGTRRTDWTFDPVNNVWSRPAYASNVLGNVTEDGVPMKFVPWTTNLATTAALMNAGQLIPYWSGSMTYDPTSRVVYIRPSSGVAGDHEYVVSEVLNGLINYNTSSGLFIDGLDLRSLSRHAIDLKNKKNPRIHDCDFHVIGGVKPASLWLGNGIELSVGVWGAETERCRFFDIFDSPVTSQLYEGSGATIGDHLWRGLHVERYGMHGVEVSAQTTGQEIRDIEIATINSVDQGICWSGDRNGAVITNVVTNIGTSRVVRSFARNVTGSKQRRLYLGFQHQGICGIEDSSATGTYGQGVRSDQGSALSSQVDLRRNITDSLAPVGATWAVINGRLGDFFAATLG